MKIRGLTLKYKVMILLTVVPLLLLAAYLALVIRIFEKDKLAYIYDTNASINRSIASQTRGILLSVLSNVKPVFQDYFSNGEFSILSKELFQSDKSLLLIAELNKLPDRIEIKQHLEKDQDYYNDLIKELTHLQFLLKKTSDENRLIRTPFQNKNVLLIETVHNPIDKSLIHFAIIFQSHELTDLFSEDQQRFFLATEGGDLLFRTNKGNTDSSFNNFLDNTFFSNIQSKKTNEGTALLKRKASTYLASYNKTGIANLIVTSIIDQKQALSAISILITKSLLFAALLLCFALLISIVSSQKITKALQDLLKATQKIAQGDFTSRVKVTAADEIGSLANSFNLMSKEVDRLMKETAEKARMEGELRTAKTVQETLFPPNVQTFDYVQIAGHYEPASECGGDWWYYSRINNKILLCIGDATGHGAPAALITSAARSAASILETLSLDPDVLMQFLNKAIYDVSKGQVMMTFFLGVIDLETSTFSYCNASHDPPYLVKSQSANSSLKKKDLIPLMEVNNSRLGQSPTTKYDKAQLSMDQNDFILFYTDGISDIRNPRGESLGERNFIKILLQSLESRENPEKFVQSLNGNLQNYRSKSELVDDVTFFCVKYGRAS